MPSYLSFVHFLAESTQRNDETNTELATSYRSASQFQITSFLERLATHKESQEKMFTDVSSALHELQTTQSSDLHGLVTSLKAMEGVVEASRLQATRSIAEDDAQKSAQREAVATSMKGQQQTMQEQLKKLVEMSKCHAAAIIVNLTASESRTLSRLETVQSTLDESRAELDTFLVEQSKKLQELQAAIDTSVQRQSKELDESKAVVTAALRDSHVRHQEELSGLKTHLAQYIEKCIQNGNEKLDEQTLLIQENAKHQQKQLLCVQTTMEKEMQRFLQAMDSQSVKQKSEATKLHECFSEVRDQLVDAKARQTELIQSHERLQTTWCNATTGLTLKHTKDMDCLSETHLKCHTTTSRKRREQLAQFVREHEELQKLVNGGCKALEDRLHTHMSNAKGKIELSSKLGKDVVDEATAASNQQLQEMETYMKKRKVSICLISHARTL